MSKGSKRSKRSMKGGKRRSRKSKASKSSKKSKGSKRSMKGGKRRSRKSKSSKASKSSKKSRGSKNSRSSRASQKSYKGGKGLNPGLKSFQDLRKKVSEMLGISGRDLLKIGSFLKKFRDSHKDKYGKDFKKIDGSTLEDIKEYVDKHGKSKVAAEITKITIAKRGKK